MKREEVLHIIMISTAVLVLVLLYFFIDARQSHFFPACPFFTLTGLFCPGCGSQRAVSALLHGDFQDAINYNVLLVVTIPLILYSALIRVSNVFRSTPVVQTIFYSPVFVRVFLVVVVLFGVLRNIPAYPFIMLAP